MFTSKFWAGFASATAIAIGLFVWFLASRESDILFPTKNFFATKDYVLFSGSIVGEGHSTMNGTVAGTCDKSLGTCRIDSVNQIGPNQVSQIHSDTIQIKQWDNTTMLADSRSVTGPKCNYYEIRINFPNQDISYNRYPNSKKGLCKQFEYKVFNWKIEDSYGWQKLTT